MKLTDIICNVSQQNEEAIIFAEKIDSRFRPFSKAAVVEIAEEEMDLDTKVIAEKYCPGLNYFLDVFLVKDMVEDFKASSDSELSEEQLEIIIRYAEFDA